MKSSIALIALGTLLAGCSSPAPATQSTPQISAAPAAKPDETAALALIRKINEAQATFFKINRRYAIEYEELIEARLLDKQPAATGYKFNLRPTPNAAAYKMSVVPADSDPATVRHFFTDQSGVIRAETGKDATLESPAIQ